MPEATLQTTVEDLKKMLARSTLSDELKTAYGEVLEQMNDEEKAQLKKIIEDGNSAKTEYEKQRLENLARMNIALDKHLKDVLREEQKYIRDQFEQMDGQEEKEELNNIEQEIKNL
ncbi:MAG: hypothetical protein V1880_00725 [Patescibacteria group bacterium]